MVKLVVVVLVDSAAPFDVVGAPEVVDMAVETRPGELAMDVDELAVLEAAASVELCDDKVCVESGAAVPVEVEEIETVSVDDADVE